MRKLAVVLAMTISQAMGAQTVEPDGPAAFEHLKSLAGDWEGTIDRPDGPPGSVQYRVASGGSVVMETLLPGSDHEMISMYFLEGKRLVMTHYCAMGNQPQMRLASASAGELRFDFAGGAGIDPAATTHVHAGRIAFPGPDRLEAEWDVHAGGKRVGTNRFFLKRKPTRP